MSEPVPARPVWAHREADPTRNRCAHKTEGWGVNGYTRCTRWSTHVYQGFPVCYQHYKKLAGDK